MSSQGGLFSQTLQDITDTKLDELAKKRNGFESRQQALIAAVDKEDDHVHKLNVLADGVKSCFGVGTDETGRIIRGSTSHPRLEIELQNLSRFLAQARYDPSVSQEILDQWQQSLLHHLDVQSVKYTYATLYGQLTMEWLSTKRKPAATAAGEDTEMEDFEHVAGGTKLEARQRWEQNVFKATDVDVDAIRQMLKACFEATPNDSDHLTKAMKALRDKTRQHERELMAPGAFNHSTLNWSIRGLMNSNLLSEEKRSVLRDFLRNDIILDEIADVLNMRMAAIDNWSWGEHVALEQRRQLNGHFNIYMEEEILQAIFLQYIGVKWSVFFKDAFSTFRKFKNVWKTSRSAMSTSEKKRLEHFLGVDADSHSSVVSEKQRIYRKDYFVSRLQDSVTQELVGEEGDEEADFEEQALGRQQMMAPQQQMQQQQPPGAMRGFRASVQQQPMQMTQTARAQMASQQARKAAPTQSGGAKRHRRVLLDHHEDFDDFFSDDPSNITSKNPMAAKQNLLHLLSADILIKTETKGELTCFRSQIDNLYPSLPHNTVTTILSFFGVSSRWLGFFKRFLQAPLKFAEDSEPRTRKQGTPGAHVLSDVFSEVVLFCLDFKINQTTEGTPLWRLGDDFWFWASSHETCESAWKTTDQFLKTTGLVLNTARTGGARMARKREDAKGLRSVDMGPDLPDAQIRWGMLVLNPEPGRFEIDQDMVSKHISELSRQLRDKHNSIFAWIQAWNSYATTFFTSNFGKPANCFGRQHVDNMLSTHERIQREIFSTAGSLAGPKSVVEYIKSAILHRFGVNNVPDGYLFLPTELGGLELSSPFVGLLQIRNAVVERPAKLMDDFFRAERNAYRSYKLAFESEYHDQNKPQKNEAFISFDEFIKYREELDYEYDDQLESVYQKLLRKPNEEPVVADDNGTVVMALNALGQQSNLRGITSNWYSMEPYWKWVAQLYGPELVARFGGFSIVDKGLLPMGMVSLFRSGRVSWQE